MYRSSIELLRINKTKLKFGLIIKDNSVNKPIIPLINKFTMRGDQYLNITPHPFITIDISDKSDKKEGWNPNSTFTLNRMYRSSFVRTARNFIEAFKIKELYFFKRGNLIINKEVAEANQTKVSTLNKNLIMRHTVIEKEGVQYEGVLLMINTVDNYTAMTYDEFVYLVEEISRIDMNSLALQLINTTMLYELLHIVTGKNNTKKLVRAIEESNNEMKDPEGVIVPMEPKKIPDI